jgi:hypothetical protein
MKNDKPRVAIQGIRASFHEEAAFKFFGENPLSKLLKRCKAKTPTMW